MKKKIKIAIILICFGVISLFFYDFETMEKCRNIIVDDKIAPRLSLPLERRYVHREDPSDVDTYPSSTYSNSNDFQIPAVLLDVD